MKIIFDTNTPTELDLRLMDIVLSVIKVGNDVPDIPVDTKSMRSAIIDRVNLLGQADPEQMRSMLKMWRDIYGTISVQEFPDTELASILDQLERSLDQ